MNVGIIVAAGEGTRFGKFKQTEMLLDKKVYQQETRLLFEIAVKYGA